MSVPKRFGIRSAANVTFYDLVTNDPVVTLNTLKMTEVNTTGDTVYSRGGRGNAKILGFSSDKEATMTLQDAIFDIDAMGMLTGNKIITEAQVIQKYEDVSLNSEAEGTLKFTPTTTDGLTIKYYLLKGNAIDSDVTIKMAANVTTKIKAESANIQDLKNKKLRVYYYYTTPATTKTITVTSDMFGGTYKLVADVLVKDEETKKNFYAQFVAPAAKIEDDFSFSFTPDGDPLVVDIPLELLKDSDSTDMWQFIIYGDES